MDLNQDMRPFIKPTPASHPVLPREKGLIRMQLDNPTTKKNFETLLRQQQAQAVDSSRERAATSRSLLLSEGEEIWENQTQPDYQQNPFMQDYLNTSWHVSSNEKAFPSSQSTHSRLALSHTRSFILPTVHTESSEPMQPALFGPGTFKMTQQLRLLSEKLKIEMRIIPENVLQDPRTTLMIANIPNKYTMQSLMSEINLFGLEQHYDFCYVPVDFTNNCNRGYAFINFVHVDYVRQFYQIFDNRRWSMYNSDKVCSVKYGTIQGFKQLVKHFKSASIMRDDRYKPYIRPDLHHSDNNISYYTSHQE